MRCEFDTTGQTFEGAHGKPDVGWPRKDLTYTVEPGENDYTYERLNEIILNSLKAWTSVCGVTFAKTAKTPDIPIRFQTEKQNKTFHEKPQVLGYAYFPGPGIGGDVTINDSYHWGDGAELPTGFRYASDEYMTHKSYVLQNVLTHELGHAIGLHHAHACPACIMNWSYNGQLIPQADDVRRAQALYGKPIKAPPSPEH